MSPKPCASLITPLLAYAINKQPSDFNNGNTVLLV